VIPSGLLRQRGRLELVRAQTRDAAGGVVDDWGTFYSEVPFSFVSSSGREYERAAQITADMTHLIRMRWIDGVTTDMRLVVGERIFQLISILDPTGRREELIVTAREMAPKAL